MKRRHRHSSPLAILGLVAAVAGLGACSSIAPAAAAAASVGVQSLLFIKRQTTTVQNGVPTVDVAGGNGQVLDYQRYVPGGSLNILSPARPDGTRDEPHVGLHARPTSTAPTCRSTRRRPSSR